MTRRLSATSRPRPTRSRTHAAIIFAGVVAAAVVLVAFAVRDGLFRLIAGTVDDGPDPVREAATLIAETGLILLVAGWCILAVTRWFRPDRGRGLVIATGAGAVGAYLASELIKVLVRQDRPCRAVMSDTVLTCPAPDDWSWPSNHATIAAALATGVVLLRRSTWPWAVSSALLIAVSRVATGVHYVHDVLTGLALGSAAILLAAGLVSDHGRRGPAHQAAIRRRARGNPVDDGPETRT